MKRFVIAMLAVVMMTGNVLAQDNKVKVVKKNAELVKRADVNAPCNVHGDCKMMKMKADSVCVMEKCQMKRKEGKVMPGKSLKLKDAKEAPVKPMKMKPVKE